MANKLELIEDRSRKERIAVHWEEGQHQRECRKQPLLWNLLLMCAWKVQDVEASGLANIRGAGGIPAHVELVARGQDANKAGE